MAQFTQTFNLSAGLAPTFYDDFSTLSLYDHHNPGNGGTWMPGRWYNPVWDGEQKNSQSWVLSPFNANTPDNSIYTIDTGGTSPFSAEFSAEFGSGTTTSALRINVKPTPASYASAVNNVPYIIGTLTTQPSFRQRFGYFEAKIRIETVQGFGGAFWLVNEINPPEIDISETVSPSGHNNDAWLSHFGIIDFSNNQSSNDWYTYQPPVNANYDATTYHTYGFDWQPDTCKVYLDRTVVESFATPPAYASNTVSPCFIVLELGVGEAGSWEGPVVLQPGQTLPRGMLVDYVAAYPSYPFG